jgi:hypothetical protein
MAERFFRAAAIAGQLHFVDLSDWDDWSSDKVQYRDDTEVRWLMRTGAGERRVIHTAAELDAVIMESAAPRGIYLYIGESLLQEAKNRWEAMTRERKATR